MSGTIEIGDAPDDLAKVRLGERQWELLDAICRTNGGGIDRDDPRFSIATFKSLARRGLIQGKSGRGWRAVHTRPGLEYWRARTAALGVREPSDET